MVDNFVMTDNSVNFRIGINPSCPNYNSVCNQDIWKIEINSCESSAR
jgi:hypothetical protein